MSFLFARVGTVAATAAGGIEKIAQSLTGLELARLDQTMRHVGNWQWPTVRSDDVARLSHGLTGVLGILASHHSGYIREAAVRCLASNENGSELPFLLIRLNDWVSNVRDPAKVAVLSRLVPAYIPHFALHLPLVFRLREQGRDDHQDVVVPVLQTLRSAESRPALMAALASPDRLCRRLAFNLLIETGEDISDVVDRGLTSDDAVIRVRAAVVARTRLEGRALEAMLKRMIVDCFMPVRREALYGNVERFPELAGDLLMRSLLDSHASIRETARFYLRERGESDLAGFYRARLADSTGDERATVVAGLGETGSREDARRVESLLDDGNPRIRKAAVRAFGRLAPDDSVERMLTALEDQSAGVVKVARGLLRPRLFLAPSQRLWSMFVNAKRPQTRRAILSLIAGLRWWDSAPMLVGAAGFSDLESSAAAKAYLDRWRGNNNRLSARPSREQLLLLDEMLRKYRSHLDQRQVDDLMAHLSYASRELT
jgi:hypothetical protein